MTVISKDYVNVSYGQVHYRHAGAGSPVVLLHDSPRSSAMHEPLLTALGRDHHAIALDTPGYGNTTPLAAEPVPDMAAFADALAEALEALGVAGCPVYGFHTSSKILLELAVRHPGVAGRVVIDGLSLPPGGADEAFIERYMAPFVVRPDGSHLAGAWSRARDLHRFFPWFDTRARARLSLDLPDPAALNVYVLDMLMAGANYSLAYTAAMRYVALGQLAKLRTPVAFMCRTNDPLYAFLDSLPGDLPAGSSIDRVSPDPQTWLELVVRRLVGPDAAPPAESGASFGAMPGVELDATRALPDPLATGGADERRGYVAVDGGRKQLHVRRFGEGTRRPLVLLPEQPGSVAALTEFAVALARDRSVYALELPGIGESDALAPGTDAAGYARILGAALTALGLDSVDVYAAFTAAPLALELACQDARVASLVLDGVPLVEADLRDDSARDYCPPLVPSTEGGHWLALWHRLRDQALAWPWHDTHGAAARRTMNPPATDALQLDVVEVGKQLANYGDAATAALRADTRAALEACTRDVLVLADEGDIRDAPLRQVPLRSKRIRIAHRAADVGERARDVLAALDG